MSKKRSGFTIVEIALVLAIAGLIFLMAFIALPSLWASQRDADRKSNIMEYISALKTYQTNNSRGALPILSGNGPEKFTWSEAYSDTSSGTWKAFVRDYVNKDLHDPSASEGDNYDLYIVKCLDGSGRDITTGQACAYNGSDFGKINDPNNLDIGNVNHTIYTVIGATCDGDHAVKTDSSRSVAAVYVLERAGRYCYNT